MTVVTKSELLILIALLFLRPQLAVGHDGWIEITPAIVEKGQIATISLIQGNHSNEHRSYRIAGKWDQKYTTLVIVDPKGKQRALTDRIIDLGEADDNVETTPLNKPIGLIASPSIALEVRHNGKPSTGKVVTLVRRVDGSASVQDPTTDDKGQVTFAVAPADAYLARVKFEEETPR